MNARKERTHISDADQGPERIKDPKAGMDRLREALKRIVKVPKEKLAATGDKGRTA